MISLNFLLCIKVMAWSSDIQCEEICISSSSREIKIYQLVFVVSQGKSQINVGSSCAEKREESTVAINVREMVESA